MKHRLLAAVLMMYFTAAHSQSTVTLYGRIDDGVEYISGLVGSAGQHTSRIRVESGDWGGSLLGLKGSEDIGGGAQVLFHLESLMNTATGTVGNGGSFFDRYATIGVSHPAYGTFLLGRELTISNNVWDFDPLGETGWSSASLDRGRNWPESSNNISYQSPKLGGLDVYGQYSLSNATSWNGDGSTLQGRADGLQLTYTSPLFQVRAIYDEIRDPTNGQLDDVFRYSREYFGGLNVFLGPFKLTAVYQTSHADRAPSVNNGITATQHVWGGVTWQATPAASVTAAAYHINANNGGGNATIYALGGQYNLSKRTLLDMEIATIHNSSTANFGLEANSAGPGGVSASGVNDNPSYGHSQSGAFVGIQHYF